MEAVDIAVAGLVVAAALVAAWMVSAAARRQSARLPPGPWGLPIVGNLPQLVGGERLHRRLAEFSKKYGPIVYLRLGGAPSIWISDANLAKMCLTGTNDRIFASRPPMEAGRRLRFEPLGSIALAPNDENWRQARKLCNVELFSAKRVEEMALLRRAEVSSLLEKVRKHIEMRGDTNQALNLTQATTLLVEGMIYRMLLDKPLAEMQDVERGIGLHATVQKLTRVMQAPMVGDFIPWLGFLDWKTKTTLDEVRTAFDLILDRIICERQQQPPTSTTVILDVLLKNLEIPRVKTIIADLIAASIDTLPTALDWILAELVANPAALRKLQEELDQVGEGKDRMLEEAELHNLVYLKATVKEAMRLHMPTPILLPHMATETCEVGGYTIPKGCRLFINAWSIGRNPNAWEDPERYMPQRFLSEKGSLIDVRGKHFELIPFGGGRRSCPGIPFALPIIELAVANLVYTFDWNVPYGQGIDLTEDHGIVASRATPLFCIPSLRH